MNRVKTVTVAICLAVFLLSCAAPRSLPPVEECPQPRFSGQAPESQRSLQNPLVANRVNLESGQSLYEGSIAGQGCVACHGISGAGNGPLASQFTPPPRNFACAKTVNSIADGQLFWIVKNGSPGTAMPDHPRFSDEEIWQLVLYLRELANP